MVLFAGLILTVEGGPPANVCTIYLRLHGVSSCDLDLDQATLIYCVSRGSSSLDIHKMYMHTKKPNVIAWLHLECSVP